MQAEDATESIEIPLDTRVAKWKSYSWILIIFGIIVYFLFAPAVTYMAASKSASLGNIRSMVAVVALVKGLGCLMLTGGFLFSALYYNEDRKTKESKGESATWSWVNIIFAWIIVAYGVLTIIRLLFASVLYSSLV